MSSKPPLVVDLDGTLTHGDIFVRWMLQLARVQPWKLPLLLGWLLRGRAVAKQRLAALFPVDAATLRYNQPLLDWIKAERAQGRTIALATACDISAARAVTDHLGVFDHVFASEGVINLKSAHKAERLQQAYPRGFVYAGNESADLKVWRAAKAAVLVNVSPSLAQRARRLFTIEAEFPRRP